MRIPLQTHLHTYRLWWRHLLHRYVWVSNGCGGGEGDWSGVTALPPRTVGKYSRCSVAQQFPSLSPLVQHVPLTRGDTRSQTHSSRNTPPSTDDNFFPVTWRSRYVISLRLIVPTVLVSFSTGSAPAPPPPISFHRPAAPILSAESLASVKTNIVTAWDYPGGETVLLDTLQRGYARLIESVSAITNYIAH